MKRLLVAMLLVPSISLAAGEEAPGRAGDPMAGWIPPKVKNAEKDKQEIMSLYRSMEAASRKGDLDAAVAHVDFPVMMMTDDSKGEAMGEAWDRERWTEVMRPFYGMPLEDVKITRKPTIFLLSDSLASVDDVVTMTMGGKTVTSRSSMFLVRRDGEWRIKAMAEGGWGDMMAASQPTAGGAQAPAAEGTGSAGSSEPQQSGSGSAAGGAQGTGAQPPPPVKEPPGTPGSGSGGQGSTERTTK